MRTADIREKYFYYYNNRKVLILNREGETDFFKVLVNFQLSEQTGENWCTACNIYTTSSHTCDDANEIIHSLLDEVTDEEVMFIHAQYIMDKPFEYKENEKLAAEIKERKKEVNALNNQRKRLVSRNANAVKQISRINRKYLNALDKKDKADREIVRLYDEIRGIKERVISFVEVPIIATDRKISASRLLELLSKEEKLKRLEIGGVDNWDFYDVSIFGVNDELPEIKEVALQNLLEI
ncbi:hypothetical protein DKL61_09265 [Gammaproteobacteria bacterium ESL0073]|nr:hypothetical protein DKL61_09265 [Gammaproteobacteria bacterium ESL0073]